MNVLVVIILFLVSVSCLTLGISAVACVIVGAEKEKMFQESNEEYIINNSYNN